MDINPKPWLEALEWAISNLPNLALLLVMAAGAWGWGRDIWSKNREESQHETWLQMVLRERNELGDENRELRNELLQVRRRRPGGRELAARPPEGDGRGDSNGNGA